MFSICLYSHTYNIAKKHLDANFCDMQCNRHFFTQNKYMKDFTARINLTTVE